MRFAKFFAFCAWCCMPVAALAIPTQTASKKQSKVSVKSRPAVSYGTPSLSPSSKSVAKVKKRESYLVRAHKSQISMVPATSNYVRGRNSTQRYMSSNKKRDEQQRRPNTVVNRPNSNYYRSATRRPVTNIQNNININQSIFNQNVISRPVTNVQVNNYQRPNPYYWQLHNHWQPSSWGSVYRPAYYNHTYSAANGGWMAVGAANYAYANPFFVRPTQSRAVWFDYSKPIRVPPANYRETTDDLIRSEQAIRRFDDAREIFRRGEYGRATDLIDEAIDLLPSDPTLHQFRALVLFARERYQESAAVLYSVLAVSSGWDAATVSKLYGDPTRYLEQVDELKRYVNNHRDATDAQFLLAYHSVLTEDFAGAERLLTSVSVASPNDRVVRSLLVALRQ